jgi:hypothetical protein
VTLGRLGELDRTVTVDPIVVNGQPSGDGAVITGTKPPMIPASWWPWLIAGGALGFAWWMSSQNEGGRRNDGPFDE